MLKLCITVSIQMMLWGSFLRQSKNSIEMLILHGASSLAISRDKYFWSSGYIRIYLFNTIKILVFINTYQIK